MTDLARDYDVSLFPSPTEPWRTSDPDTAKDAGRTTDTAAQRAVVLEALTVLGDGTADEVCAWLNTHRPVRLGWQRNVVSSRLSQLKDEDRYPNGTPVRDTEQRRLSDYGKPVIVFEPTGADA